MVLLRNDAGLLPLTPGGQPLALVGPFANYTAIAGNYFEVRAPQCNAIEMGARRISHPHRPSPTPTLVWHHTPQDICATGPHGDLGCVPTLLAAVAAANGGTPPAYAPGCDVGTPDPSGIPAAVAACNRSTICILALGDNTEGEGQDRTDTALPGAQVTLALAVLAVGKPTVVVLFSGATLAVDAIVNAPRAAPLAIVAAWMPGVAGGTPVASALFGATNRWGKLPVSWYPAAYFTLLPIQVGRGRAWGYWEDGGRGASRVWDGPPSSQGR